MREERIARLLAKLPEQAEALIVTNPLSLHYLTGFRGDAGVLLLSSQARILAVDPRYTEQARHEVSHAEVREVRDPWPDVLASLIAEQQARCVAFEAEHVTVLQLRRWQERVGTNVQFTPAEALVPSLRAVKDDGEIAAIRRAVRLADQAMDALRSWLRPGVTEQEAAWFVESFLRTHGAEAVAFPPIVASGPNAALPHARPTCKLIEKGEPIVIDIGAVVDGYCSDLTRTLVLGTPDETFRNVFDVVLRAQEAAEQAARPGMPCRELDAVARGIIEAQGYGPHFGHGLGHGVGLEVHERPSISSHSQESLVPGNVFTVEPGVYLPGWGGVRIEDLMAARGDAVEALTQSPKEPWL